ncbi:MAG: rod shape-determining protein MreC [Jaaginema sp. PMC 1079.18]|nr:rod shape-determining protein MreC [Jaaginema sp. PMC 1080.18]MEC4851086.1 rod shape-determining protein MreC [Jaaginema sp. PMC 1079.18]MEC4867034.1 rod shape-determining protein MreC [Jaaginema sp. PMC 1078.18]
MFTVRRWWDRYGSQAFIIALALGTALVIRQTQGAVLSELYYWVVRPIQPRPLPEERLANARVQELESRLGELEQQNQSLKELLNYQETEKRSGVVAPIIGRNVDGWWNHIIIGRGQNHGISLDDVVTGPGGLVGRAIQVTPNTSRILLVSDPTSRVGVTVSRSREMGFMVGDDSELAVMEFFEKVPNVKEGDKIVTSRVSQRFPEGIPVGVVQSVDIEKSPAPQAVVKLTVPFEHLEWVVVHPFDRDRTLPE